VNGAQVGDQRARALERQFSRLAGVRKAFDQPVSNSIEDLFFIDDKITRGSLSTKVVRSPASAQAGWMKL
jgi:hypothetical protein